MFSKASSVLPAVVILGLNQNHSSVPIPRPSDVPKGEQIKTARGSTEESTAQFERVGLKHFIAFRCG